MSKHSVIEVQFYILKRFHSIFHSGACCPIHSIEKNVCFIKEIDSILRLHIVKYFLKYFIKFENLYLSSLEFVVQICVLNLNGIRRLEKKF